MIKFLISSFCCLLMTTNIFAADFPPVKGPLIVETKLITPEMKAQNPNNAVCAFARKDYDSPGFGITYRKGFYIQGQFGCVYYCGCKGQAYYVTHIYQNKYFDSEIWTKDTGGPKRAKWFICPHSVDETSWKPITDELGRVIGYNVTEDNSFFEPLSENSIPILTKFEEEKCR